jgi:hypothetical protein
MSLARHQIKIFLSKPRPNVAIKYLYALFPSDTSNQQISYEHFRIIMNEISKVKVVKTGGADCKLPQLAGVLVQRILSGVRAENTISIDEKCFILKNKIPWKIRCLKDHHFPIYLPIFKNLNIPPIYLICCISLEGIPLFALSNDPINTLTFNAFIYKLFKSHGYQESPKFFLLDNAKFHQIETPVQEHIYSMNFLVTHTAPSTCLLNPIEEFFSMVASKFQSRLSQAIVRTGKFVPFLRKEIEHEIIGAIIDSKKFNFRGAFNRALLS